MPNQTKAKAPAAGAARTYDPTLPQKDLLDRLRQRLGEVKTGKVPQNVTTQVSQDTAARIRARITARSTLKAQITARIDQENAADEALLKKLGAQAQAAQKQAAQRVAAAKKAAAGAKATATTVPLSKVAGVGAAYARRLAKEGVTSAAALAKLSKARLIQVTGASDKQATDILAKAKAALGKPGK